MASIFLPDRCGPPQEDHDPSRHTRWFRLVVAAITPDARGSPSVCPRSSATSAPPSTTSSRAFASWPRPSPLIDYSIRRAGALTSDDDAPLREARPSMSKPDASLLGVDTPSKDTTALFTDRNDEMLLHGVVTSMYPTMRKHQYVSSDHNTYRSHEEGTGCEADCRPFAPRRSRQAVRRRRDNGHHVRCSRAPRAKAGRTFPRPRCARRIQP